MKKIIDKKIFLVIAITSVIGLIFGIMFLFLLDKVDKLLIKTELIDFIDLIKSSEYNIKESIINTSIDNIFYFILIFIFSTIFILSPCTLFISFYNLFTVGFLISSMFYTFKLKGILYIFYLLFPFKLLNIIVSLIFIMYSLKYSKKIYLFFKTNEKINIKEYTKRYSLLFLIFVISSIILSILEIYTSIFLIKL